MNRGRLMEDFFDPDTTQQFKQAIGHTLETGETTQIEYEATIDNNGYWFLASLSKLDEEKVFWVARDITERKRAEATLQRRNTYLSVSSEIGRYLHPGSEHDLLADRESDQRTIWLLSRCDLHRGGDRPTPSYGAGEASAEMLRRKHTLAVDSN
jgi:hypothetical protein